MGVIYCLYSTDDFQPRYVGQAMSNTEDLFKRHIANALEYKDGALYDWMREVWRRGYEVELHVLQDGVAPFDLELYERYWVDQFSKLVNIRHTTDSARNTDIGEQIKAIIRQKHA